MLTHQKRPRNDSQPPTDNFSHKAPIDFRSLWALDFPRIRMFSCPDQLYLRTCPGNFWRARPGVPAVICKPHLCEVQKVLQYRFLLGGSGDWLLATALAFTLLPHPLVLKSFQLFCTGRSHCLTLTKTCEWYKPKKKAPFKMIVVVLLTESKSYYSFTVSSRKKLSVVLRGLGAGKIWHYWNTQYSFAGYILLE